MARAQNEQSSGMPLSLVVKIYLLACTTGTWCVNTGATNHVCNSLKEFQETRRLAEGRSIFGWETLLEWRQLQWEMSHFILKAVNFWFLVIVFTFLVLEGT